MPADRKTTLKARKRSNPIRKKMPVLGGVNTSSLDQKSKMAAIARLTGGIVGGGLGASVPGASPLLIPALAGVGSQVFGGVADSFVAEEEARLAALEAQQMSDFAMERMQMSDERDLFEFDTAVQLANLDTAAEAKPKVEAFAQVPLYRRG